MKSKSTGIICGSTFLIGALINCVILCSNVLASLLNNPTKLFVILLANWQQLAFIICDLLLAISLFSDDFEKGLNAGLIALTFITAINVLYVFKVAFLSSPLNAVITSIRNIVPIALILIMYIKTRQNRPVLPFYIPSLMYFVLNITSIASLIISYRGGLISFYFILSIVSFIIGTLEYFTLGLYIKENR